MIVVLVLGIIGVIGWRVYDANVNKPTVSQTGTPTSSVPAEIQSTSDLDKASQALDNTDVVGSYDSQLNTQTDF
jgi:predicted negative regulator of RcsB-dependent stress response